MPVCPILRKKRIGKISGAALALIIMVPKIGAPQEHSAGSVLVASETCFLNSSPNGDQGSFVTHRDGHLIYFSNRDVYESSDGGRLLNRTEDIELPNSEEEMRVR